MKKFDDELVALKRRLSEMAELTREMVQAAEDAIKNPGEEKFRGVESQEKELDQQQVEIDGEAIRLLTVYGPVAGDLRTVLVITHVTSQLERMGDQVVNICESLRLVGPRPATEEILKMASVVCSMVQDAIAAYFNNNIELAEETRRRDDLVDALNAQVFKTILSDEVLREIIAGTKEMADALAEILVARQLERIADQAVNICKEVIYVIHGDDVRHVHRP